MLARFAPAPRRRDDGNVHVPIVAAFWLFTYALLSFRATMLAADDFSLVSARRIVAITVGAGIFWLVLDSSKRHAIPYWPKQMMAIAVILPASLLVLIARIFWDLTEYSGFIGLEENIRWVLLWGGYFGLWISVSIASGMQRPTLASSRQKQTSRVIAATLALTRTPKAPAMPEPEDSTWAWAIEAIVKEMESSPPSTRKALAERIRTKAGYEIADPLDISHNQRVWLMNRIAARLEDEPRPL